MVGVLGLTQVLGIHFRIKRNIYFFFHFTDADNIFLRWELTEPTQNKLADIQVIADCQTNPPIMKHLIFTSDVQQMQTDKSELNILNTNHKRCSTLDVGTNKRLKCNTMSDCDLNVLNSIDVIQQENLSSNPNLNQQPSMILQNSYLLQQLMAPTPQRVGRNNCLKSKRITDNLNGNTQWNQNGGCDRTADQTNESVLKNLLVSGCDIGAGYICNVPVRLKKLAKA